MLGQTISHYKITDKLGEGGMGVVYKAEDTKLERTVALKFLAAHLVSDDDVRKRFEREAKAAASLNHPNICHVYEIDEADGRTFIAMAFIEGQGLDDKIAAGPLKLNEALDIAHQIAEGLQEAHAHGIVHRDIKPANIMVTPKGGSKAQVTIMDFGLAQLTEHSKLTRMDETMGTVAYMSPEQTMGAEVDHRTDIWALGVVLYEMIAGQRPFKGHYDKAVMYSITSEDPEPLTALRTGVPMELEWMIGKCLAKEADSRYQHAGDLAVDLKNLQEKLKSGRSAILRTSAPGTVVGARPAVPMGTDPSMMERAQHAVPLQPRWKRHLPWAIAAVMALALVIVAFLYFSQISSQTPEAPLRRFAVATPAPVPTGNYTGDVSISPDGRHIAYATTDGRLWVQSLGQLDPRRIEGTSQARFPFWSPDSEFIGFADGTELRKVSLRQGIPTSVCNLPPNRFDGAAWSPDAATIVFTVSTEGIYSVPAQGGTPQKIFEHNHAESPSFLPLQDGRAALLFATLESAGIAHQIKVLLWGASEAQVVASSPSGRPGPFFSPTGHIVYVGGVTGLPQIWALPFSLAKLAAEGDAFPIAEPGVAPTVSNDGTLVYVPIAGGGEREFVWLDRRGEKTAGTGLVGFNLAPEISPDERFVAYQNSSGGGGIVPDVWVYDLVRKARTRLTSDPRTDMNPIWSPDGEQVAFSSVRAGNFDIFIRRADGGGPETAVLATERAERVSDWSRDGRYLLYCGLGYTSGSIDIGYLLRKQDGSGWEPHPFLQTTFREEDAKISPDGHYAAYASNESGRMEIYVQPFPEGGRRVTVSSEGGQRIRWRRDGKELFYVDEQALMTVPVSTTGEFTVGQAARLFEHPGLLEVGPGNGTPYDVSADGKRFLLSEPVAAADVVKAAPPSLHVVLNWFAEFRGRQTGER